MREIRGYEVYGPFKRGMNVVSHSIPKVNDFVGLITMQVDGDILVFVYFEVDPTTPLLVRSFRAVNAGEQYDERKTRKVLGSAVIDRYAVIHVLEITPA